MKTFVNAYIGQVIDEQRGNDTAHIVNVVDINVKFSSTAVNYFF